jgi:hypothetical protein
MSRVYAKNKERKREKEKWTGDSKSLGSVFESQREQ